MCYQSVNACSCYCRNMNIVFLLFVVSDIINSNILIKEEIFDEAEPTCESYPYLIMNILKRYALPLMVYLT